jgi:hypothetical protein
MRVRLMSYNSVLPDLTCTLSGTQVLAVVASTIASLLATTSSDLWTVAPSLGSTHSFVISDYYTRGILPLPINGAMTVS